MLGEEKRPLNEWPLNLIESRKVPPELMDTRLEINLQLTSKLLLTRMNRLVTNTPSN